MSRYIGSIDQGTTSTRFILFNEDCQIVNMKQMEHTQYFPSPGWVEHDVEEIWANTEKLIQDTIREANIEAKDILSIGITNQRETTVAFNPKTGEVYHKALVWQDLRTSDIVEELETKMEKEELNEITGLLFSSYFSATKIMWLLKNVEGLREKANNGDCIFGTIDTYLTYKLTGTIITDVTNASRYMLMNIKTLEWDDRLLTLCNIPKQALPKIVPSIGEIYGHYNIGGVQVPICGILGDQQAALFGQTCLAKGEAKCTYGTGCFMLVNTGKKVKLSKRGLLSTVAYQIKGKKPVYALEGSVAIAGSLVQWARDNLHLVNSAQELDKLASEVEDNGGVYIVPAFSGLYAPYWDSSARGIITGLTAYVNNKHIARAILEAIAFQAYDIFKVIEEESNIKLTELRVDGGLTNSRPLMEFQANIIDIDVVRPLINETTALGAAFASGITIGLFKEKKEIKDKWVLKNRWKSNMKDEVRKQQLKVWTKAIETSKNWV